MRESALKAHTTAYDKLRGFVDDMEKLGKQLSTTHRSYEDAMTKLTRGKGNLISQAHTFVEMGVKVKKPISKAVSEASELETDDLSELEEPIPTDEEELN